MFRKITKLICVVLCFVVLVGSSVVAFADNTNSDSATILFTHDLHSHFLPSYDPDGTLYGGYAKLATAINQQKEKYPDAILVDGGDFSMGSLFQTAYTSSATELRIMGAMGYDVTTFGNHEFDYLPEGLRSMLFAATIFKDPVPYIVNSNYLPKPDDTATIKAFNDYGVEDYVLIERGGVYFAVFGIFGFDADACAPNSGLELKDPVEYAKNTVNKAVTECLEVFHTEPVVICLSHSGTSDGKGEDYDLAKKVDGIDVIVSGHTHTTLTDPITVNGTYIVSAGEYGRNLGSLTLNKNGSNWELARYELIPINASVADDGKIAELIQGYKAEVENTYLSNFSLGFDEVLVNNPYKFDTVDEVYATQHESTLCNIFSDAYKWAVEKATGERVDMALTAAGVIRDSLPTGDITVSNVFNAASLGVGTEGELVAVYITGRDLKNALEVDASVQPIMRSAQLFCSGVEYSFNTNRMIFNKVDYAALRRDDGTVEKIENDKLYRVVTGMYCGQMLGAVKSTSFGLLEITPRDKDGNPIAAEDLKNYVVYDNRIPLKEWYAIASYLKEMGGSINEKYSAPDGRKVVYSSLNPVKLLRNANKFTFILLAVILIIIVAIVFIVRAIVKKHKRKKVINE